MAINGIYGFSNSNYQSIAGLLQLSGSRSTAKYQAVSPIKPVEPVSSKTSAYADTVDFLNSYNKELTELEKISSKLQESSRDSVFSDYTAKSSDSGIAEVKNTYRLKPDTEITLEVNSMAKAQKNTSGLHDSQRQVESGADMNFQISSEQGTVSVSVSSMNENGTQKTYNQMYQEAAKAINSDPGSGVTASVVNQEGKVSLVLAAKDTGTGQGFTVSGDTGAADNLAAVSEAAENAVYTVTQDDVSYTGSSESNKISLDYGRMEAEIKGTGTAQISVGTDTDKIVSSVEDLVKQYNSVTNVLKDNVDRGTGAEAQYESFKRGMADDKTLKHLGITYNKDGNLELDKDTLKKALAEDYEGTKALIGGQFGIAGRASQKADSALTAPVQRIVNKDLASSASTRSEQSISFEHFSDFARSGPYNLGNYYALGLMLNTMA
ncbi:flagellar filament capping protein FliD [Hungatella hathewayi]|uniref:flagellar filament capping protein FliD n=1 Tax=Hungatella hathewayi TaxID=154046 RepID=UPI0035640A06